MGLQLYLACTAEEIQAGSPIPGHTAFMACHFSPYGNGLMMPSAPSFSCDMVILNDRIPVMGHDPELIARELMALAEQAGAGCILLDLQRKADPRTAAIVRAVCALSLPVGVTPGYTQYSAGPVLTELPMHRPLEDARQRWPGRELWLDVAANNQRVCVTEEGAIFTDLPPSVPEGPCHRQEQLHCSYHIEVREDRAEFTLFRTKEDLQDLLQEAERLGFAKAVGLYQELRDRLSK